jgi:hypothetical protein
MFGLAAMIALLAMLLPAAAGVALGHTATTKCDRITNDPSYGPAVVWVHNPNGADATIAIPSLAAGATAIIGPGSYDIVWNRDGYTQRVLVVSMCQPTIATVANPTTGTVGAPMTVGDTATLSDVPDGLVAFDAGSSVTFKLYSGNLCTGTPVVSGSALIGAVSGGQASAIFSTSPSTWTPPAAGTYTWYVNFAGDTYNHGISACGGSQETILIRPSTTTVSTTVFDAATNLAWSGNETVGASAYDTSSVNGQVGAVAPTGKISYTYFTNGTCAPTGTAAGNLLALGTKSSTEGPLGSGSYSFQATYSGDSNYSGSTSVCEPFSLGKAPPPKYGNLLITKIVNGYLTNFVGATFTFDVTCGGAALGPVSITVASAGGSVSASPITGLTPGITCTVIEVTPLPDPGANASWGTSPTYDPTTGSVTIVSGATVTVTATNTRSYQNLEGATATPAPTSVVKGVTATAVLVRTPPPTSSGSGSSGDSPTPFFALMICLAFAGLGLLAVQAQRRTLRR